MPLPYSSPIQGWSKRLDCWVRAEEVMEKSSKNLRRQQRVFDAVGKKTDGGVQLLRVLQHCPLLHLLLFDHSLHPFLLSLPLRLDLPRHLLLERITLTLKQVCEPPLVVVRAVAAAAARATEQWH